MKHQRIATALSSAVLNLLLLLLCALFIKGMARVEHAVNPCEITHHPRHYTYAVDEGPEQAPVRVDAVVPGGTYILRAKYEVVRKGCTARFHVRQSWHAPDGPRSIALPAHHGSFDVTGKTMGWIGRKRVVPVSAMPGTVWVDEVDAYWNAWGMGWLTEVSVPYAEIRLPVVAR